MQVWIYLHDAFYAIRAYDPAKGGIPVEGPYVVVRARVKEDLDQVRKVCPSAFDLPEGSDYRYHLAVHENEFKRFLAFAVQAEQFRPGMKDPSDRTGVHAQVWLATMALDDLDGERREREVV